MERLLVPWLLRAAAGAAAAAGGNSSSSQVKPREGCLALGSRSCGDGGSSCVAINPCAPPEKPAKGLFIPAAAGCAVPLPGGLGWSVLRAVPAPPETLPTLVCFPPSPHLKKIKPFSTLQSDRRYNCGQHISVVSVCRAGEAFVAAQVLSAGR